MWLFCFYVVILPKNKKIAGELSHLQDMPGACLISIVYFNLSGEQYIKYSM
jgi:hypothetical protein